MLRHSLLLAVFVAVTPCLNEQFMAVAADDGIPAEGAAQVTTNGDVRPDKSNGNGGAFSNIFGASRITNILDLINLDATGDNPVPIDGNAMNNQIDASTVDTLAIARKMASSGVATVERSIPELIEHFKSHFDESTAMMKQAFQHIDFSKLSIASLFYYMEKTEQTKTPSWKRRVHRYHKRLKVDTILELHDVLYLMQVAYLPTKELIIEHVKNFRNGTYEVIDAVTTGSPTEPAHFIMMPKEVDGKKLGSIAKENSIADFWSGIINPKDDTLEIVIAIRGTGDVGDLISDSMLNATAYKKGLAHDGIARAGKKIAGQYIGEIRKLLKASGREKVEIALIGYSLGAGVAAIAAMELNEYDFIDARSIGFGCPALLDLEQSIETKPYITTIVTDSDIVSRMSGPSIANMFLDIMSYDWIDTALLDLQLWLDTVDMPYKEGILTWANHTLFQKVKPNFNVTKERMDQVLYPPGNCIHLWRNGVGWSGTYTPCSFFDSVEFSRTLLDDHLLEPGYHPALLGLAREVKGDLNFHFDHDLMALSKLL